jgi:multiple antibiotic resistance protein
MRPWSEYIQVMISLLAMCTAPALVPVFLGMTAHMEPAGRKRTAWGVAVTVVVALAIMIFFGEDLFKIMGIDIHQFRVGGGILILIWSISMVNSEPPSLKPTPTDQPTQNPAVVPLGIPIVAGPGLLAAMLIHSSQMSGFQDDLILLACALTMGLYVLVTFLMGESLVKWLGQAGIGVIMKISGLLLTAVAVGFITSGLKVIFPILNSH